jgi:hypothetical protein
MHTTTGLRPYVPKVYPSVGDDGATRLYLVNELKAISDGLRALIAAAQQLEQRIVAGGL